MKYLKVWTDFSYVLETLEYDEIGRLFLAMLHYAETGEEPPQFDGNERFVWPVARRDIDMASAKAEILRVNGLKPKSKRKQTEANESKQKQTEANESQKEKKGKEIEKKGKEKEDFIDVADAQAIQHDHDRILDAAKDAGFKMTNNEMAALISLYADHGEKVLDGIRACSEHGVPTLAYLRGCMNDAKKPVKANVPAQAYTQRNYDGEQEDAMRRMLRVVSE